MKLTVSFELDLTNTPGYNIDTVEDIHLSIQNLSSLISRLHQHNLERIIDTGYIEDENTRKALEKIVEHDIALSEQIFNNYRVEGTTEDNHPFTFSHREPGYVERLFVDGKLVE